MTSGDSERRNKRKDKKREKKKHPYKKGGNQRSMNVGVSGKSESKKSKKKK
ncbi:MAG: hypothetical protein ABIA78_00360 [archaeon]